MRIAKLIAICRATQGLHASYATTQHAHALALAFDALEDELALESSDASPEQEAYFAWLVEYVSKHGIFSFYGPREREIERLAQGF